MTHDLHLVLLLKETEMCLKRQNLWGKEKPNDIALSSKEPFALNTLEPEQWLQWIFIPKMMEKLNQEDVPKGFSISPYFSEVWKADSKKSELILLLNKIDEECR